MGEVVVTRGEGGGQCACEILVALLIRENSTGNCCSPPVGLGGTVIQGPLHGGLETPALHWCIVAALNKLQSLQGQVPWYTLLANRFEQVFYMFLNALLGAKIYYPL